MTDTATRSPSRAESAAPPGRGGVLATGPRVLALPTLAALLLVGGGLLFSGAGRLLPAFVGAAAVLLVWTLALGARSRSSAPPLVLAAGVYKHHWVQALAQIVIYTWWGMHVRLVVALVPLIVAQIVFAYGVESLLNWSRRGRHALGFGPLPIVFSINLFLSFRPEWFHWQFAMILLGYAAKELIRWRRDGRSAHIFNPSSFPLAVASLALIATRSTNLTFGQAIATTPFYAPHMYVLIFLVSLPAQLLFGVARMTLAAIGSLYTFSLAFHAVTGTYFFYDQHIPLPVFLGMHLLFTDPSTSPRSEQGRILFGVIYAAGVAVLYQALLAAGIPTFYDKLLPVPLMNLMVRAIDRLVASGRLRSLDPARLGAGMASAARNAAWTGIWVVAFTAMLATRGVGYEHPGQSLRFWLDACDAGKARACRYATAMAGIYCNDGSGWACNEWGIRQRAMGRTAGSAFERACELGYTPGCDNAARAGADAGALAHGDPTERDLPIVLRGARPPLEDLDPLELRDVACLQGWAGPCAQAAMSDAG